jgi:hypothetical protein
MVLSIQWVDLLDKVVRKLDLMPAHMKTGHVGKAQQTVEHQGDNN